MLKSKIFILIFSSLLLLLLGLFIYLRTPTYYNLSVSTRKIVKSISLVDVKGGEEQTGLRPVKEDVTRECALLFLTENAFPLAEIWDCWLGQAKSQAHLWLSYKEICAPFCADKPECHCVQADSNWGVLSQVYLGLLIEALKDQDKKYFILISQSTIPVKSLDYILKELTHSEDSLFCPVLSQLQIGDGWYRKHHQWIILNRVHAMKIVQRLSKETINHEFSMDKFVGGAFDEYVMSLFITGPNQQEAHKNFLPEDQLISWLSPFNVSIGCHTFARWRDDPPFERIPEDISDQEVLYHPFDFGRITEEDLQRLLNNPRLFFARKFHPWTTVGEKMILIEALAKHFHWENCLTKKEK